MSQVNRSFRALAVGCALLATLAVGCSKQSGVPFDPDAGHPDDYITTHPAAYRNAGGACTDCHGGDLLGGISTVSCFSTSRDGQACHPDGPGGHPPGWRALHSADPSKAATCAPCHDNPSNNLAPNCFNNSLCHGAKSTHPAGWRTTHQSTSQSAATGCAGCHPEKGAPSCFTVSACHGSGGGHPAGWSAGSQHGATAKAAPGGASGFLYCESCHGSGLNGGSANQSCLISGCHGWSAPHASSGWNGGGSRHRSTKVGNVTVCAQCHPVSAPSSGSTCSHNGGACHRD